MADPLFPFQTTHAGHGAPRVERPSAADSGDTHSVEAVVVALIPQYHQVQVRDREGDLYALTRKTQGIDLTGLHEGQRVVCTVTNVLPRVLAAAAVA